MRIARMIVHWVQWPLRMKRRHGVGDVEKTLGGVILELHTDDGAIGWGEAAPWSVFSGTAEANAAALDVYLRAVVVGADPRRISMIMDTAQHAVVGHPEAKVALEMALYDLAGKRLGVPVAQLLGGVYRERIPLSVSIANPDFEEDLDWARARIDEGVRLFKVKTGFLSHADDLRRMERLKAIMPADAELRIDYNQGLEPWDALRKLRDMEAFRPGFIEQPVARDQRAWMGEFARALDTPILADESCFNPEEAIELVRDRYADCVSVKLMKAGGMIRAREIAAICGAAGIPCYGGTMFEGGIAIAAGIHLICATPNISLGAEFYTANHVLGIDILENPINLEGGNSHLPAGPGLGVAIDRERLSAITIARRE
ncbi:MAG: enolase C-terminal domain-like protein [Burkholderiales bacterium]